MSKQLTASECDELNSLIREEAKEEIEERLFQLGIEANKEWKRRGSNPYPFCPYCERTNVEVSLYGHHTFCSLPAIEEEIKELRLKLAALSD